MTPQAQMSTGFPQGSFFSTSGDRQPGVPAKPARTVSSIQRWRTKQFQLLKGTFLSANNSSSLRFKITGLCDYNLGKKHLSNRISYIQLLMFWNMYFYEFTFAVERVFYGKFFCSWRKGVHGRNCFKTSATGIKLAGMKRFCCRQYVAPECVWSNY